MLNQAVEIIRDLNKERKRRKRGIGRKKTISAKIWEKRRKGKIKGN